MGRDHHAVLSGPVHDHDQQPTSQFFRVRLWDADAVIEELLGQYDRLPAEIRAELPLKRIWTVASQDEEA